MDFLQLLYEKGTEDFNFECYKTIIQQLLF